ncbi:copper resistance CopC family protein [Micromonospora endophytica]|uniref:copper resistance CopC family protein n=1 Tax=Micromonospora endophytica TaxID=515350 RepID=UPI001CB95E81|nr:copper resistance CopC family protein [Micromonospora endophytica]
MSGLLVLVLVAAVGLLGTASPASAHGGLAMSTPAADATVREPLTTVQLYFTEQVVPNAYFAIIAPGGGRVDNGWSTGAPRPLDQPVREYFLVDGKFEPREYTTGFPAVVNLAHLPAAGKYTVSYLSVASDGEPVRGTMSFQYTGPVTPAPQGWSPPTGQPDPALVAATEQHGHDAAPAPASAGPSAVASPPVAAPMPTVEETGPPGWIWAAGAVLFGLALILLVAGRRHPAAVAALLGRVGLSTGTGHRSSTRARTGVRAGIGAKKSRPDTARRTAAAKAGTGRPAGAKTKRTASAAAISARTAPAAASAAAPTAVSTAAAPLDAEVSSSEVHAGAPAPDSRWGNTRLALLVGGLVVTLLAGFGLGRLGTGAPVAGDGPLPSSAAGTSGPLLSAADGHQHSAGTGAHTHPGDGPDQTQATGVWASVAGFTLRPAQRSQRAGVRADYRFQIVGPDRKPATTFATVHERPLHMIVVGRDLDGYQHLHPTMAADGTWTVPLELDRPGGYRIYADFSVITADNSTLPLVLGVDHQVPGAYAPAELAPPRPQASAGPYAVTMAGAPTIGVSTPLTFRIGREGASSPVTPEPYLGAYGHLVVVREGDLGYVHVHPEPELVDGTVMFWLTAPSAGRYRAFFDFQVDGEVHTAQYTIDLG